jgi:hypothetical protein
MLQLGPLEILHQCPQAKGLLVEIAEAVVSINAEAAAGVQVFKAPTVHLVHQVVLAVPAPHLLFLGLQ